MRGIEQVIAKLAIAGARRALAQEARRFILGCIATMRRRPAEAVEMAAGMAEVAEVVDATERGWVDTIADGGDFDACDLRIWLELAREAGVPFVPGRTILSLDEGELERLAGPVPMPGYLREGLARLVRATFGGSEAEAGEEAGYDIEALREKLAQAMDDVPEGWIVRSHICGPDLLKAWAGSGTLDEHTALDGGRSLEVGPGWVRIGNRRRVDAADTRYITLFPRGHGKTIHYLARPWVDAARRAECEDPHRHGTIFAGKGSWPCEWRVFFEDAAVTGVAFYYGWAGEATPENARKALEARAAAEKIIAAAERAGVSPRLMDIEILKHHRESGAAMPPAARQAVERFGEGLSGTLDFIETGQGMTLLEGGPAHTPIGGAHPCAFAGTGQGAESEIDGVALKLMDHVVMADPATWKDGDRRGAVLTWEEAAALAGGA